MTDIVLHIYDYMRRHRAWCLSLLLVTTALLAVLVSRLDYKEDITDFLPLEPRHQQALQVYQDIVGAGRMLAVFQHRDTTATHPDELSEAVALFVSTLADCDTARLADDILAQADMERMAEVAAFAYSHIPYFLTDADYRRMDSLLAQPDYLRRQLDTDKQMLLFPASGLLSDNLQRDPLNLFTPVVSLLQGSQEGLMNYELYDGYIFSADMRRAIVVVNSPFGASETDGNARLLSVLQQAADSVSARQPAVAIHFTGGPAIAVGNAKQIKTDSLLSVALALVLILLLLYVTLRSWRHLLLIFLSIGWGWLFAMGCLSLVHHEVSVIVVGISSIILGIAVNYPLHLIDHLGHTPDVRSSLREIVMPLVVGNVTTVGAFLTLVPLDAVALRDLGLFSAFLLVGTIVFVLLFLPHAVRKNHRPAATLLSRIGNVSLDDKPRVVIPVVVLTAVLAWFSLRTSFDTDMHHINYMTPEQQADMAYLQQLTGDAPRYRKVYVVATGSSPDEALSHSSRLQPLYRQLLDSGRVAAVASCHHFLVSQAEQQQRLQRWQAWLSRHREILLHRFPAQAAAAGFAPDSFDEFLAILRASYAPQPLSAFRPLTRTAFASSLSLDSLHRRYSVVDVLSVRPADTDVVSHRVNQAAGTGAYSFDIESVNAAMAVNLSDNFNYIGWACGLIVFLFLWFSLGNIELALLSFIPMAVSWLWILGLMSLFGIQFNIVNVILATFIFGQGDDYTIFMTEGSCYEYAYRRRMLASYKHSIMLSALIMFIGIGTLIVARHPALHSLAEVTIVGMFSVVLMAYIFPPLIFRWLVADRRGFRRRPITLRRLLLPADDSPRAVVADRYRYRGVEIATAVRRQLRYWHRRPADLPAPDADGIIALTDRGWGETALLLALTYPDATVRATMADADRQRVAAIAADGLVSNLILSPHGDNPSASPLHS